MGSVKSFGASGVVWFARVWAQLAGILRRAQQCVAYRQGVPVRRVVAQSARVAGAGVGGGDAVGRQVHRQQLVHIPQHEHVRVELRGQQRRFPFERSSP